jgi:hypothetical protein
LGCIGFVILCFILSPIVILGTYLAIKFKIFEKYLGVEI